MKKINSSNTKQRSSNLELFRIITMFLIVAHHYVVHSGLTDILYSTSPSSFRNVFLLILGAWGKTGINCFVLITGFFMCKSNTTPRKYFKLLAEVMFYKITLFFILLICNKTEISFSSLLETFLPTTTVSNLFADCFLIFYLLIPFINILIRNLNKKSHCVLIGIMIFSYTIMGTIPWFTVITNYLSWFFVIYLVAAFIRLYPNKWTEKTAFWGLISLSSIALSIASMLLIYFGKVPFIGTSSPYFFVADSHKLMALIISVSSFLFFKNLKLPYSPFINAVGATTFGVLLIHIHSKAMTNLIWNETLATTYYYTTPYVYLHAFISIILVFSVCSILDFFRIKFIEPFTMKLFDNFIAKKHLKKQ